MNEGYPRANMSIFDEACTLGNVAFGSIIYDLFGYIGYMRR